jgi:DNA-3-methyladenine glycosylase II
MDDLRAIKLSTRKAEYILDIASKALDGTLADTELRAMTDSEVEQRLLTIRGVGPWTVSWAMLRALGREDAFPSGDLALQRVVSRLYFGGRKVSARELEEFSQRWRPYRSFVTLYTFAAARMGVLPDAGAPQEVGP